MTAQGRVSYVLEIISLSTFGRAEQALSAKQTRSMNKSGEGELKFEVL